jgi:hypothetical protein
VYGPPLNTHCSVIARRRVRIPSLESFKIALLNQCSFDSFPLSCEGTVSPQPSDKLAWHPSRLTPVRSLCGMADRREAANAVYDGPNDTASLVDSNHTGTAHRRPALSLGHDHGMALASLTARKLLQKP